MKRGEGKSSINFSRHSSNLVHVIYTDPVLFRNSNPKLYVKPDIRETIGWFLNENNLAVQVIWDKSLKRLPNDRTSPEECGLTIPRNVILGMKSLISSPQIDKIRKKSKKSKVEDDADH